MKSYKQRCLCRSGHGNGRQRMAPITAFAAEDFQQPTDNTVNCQSSQR